MDAAIAVGIVALSALGSALGGFLKEYLASRGRKAGEIDAMSANLREVLRQLHETTRVTEAVKATISGGLWVEQERWKLKRDAYLSLLESLEHVAGCMLEARLLADDPPQRAQILGAALKRLEDEGGASKRAEMTRARLIARLIMTPEAFQAIEALTREVAKVDAIAVDPNALSKLFEVHKRGFDALVSAARVDLQLGPSTADAAVA